VIRELAGKQTGGPGDTGDTGATGATVPKGDSGDTELQEQPVLRRYW